MPKHLALVLGVVVGILVITVVSAGIGGTQPSAEAQQPNCSPAYPDICVPPPPPDLDCAQLAARNFRVLAPDPHGFDGNDNDGLGCEDTSVPRPANPADSPRTGGSTTPSATATPRIAVPNTGDGGLK